MANNAGDDINADNIDDENVDLDNQNLDDDDDAAEGDDDAGNSDDDANNDAGSGQGDDDDGDDDDDARKQRGKSHINRVTEERNYYRDLAAGKNPEKPDWIKDKPANSSKPQGKVAKVDEATLARLEIRGVLNSDDQAYVVKFAKTENISVVDALEDPLVKDRLAANKRQREQAGSSNTPNNRVGAPSSKSVDAWVRKVQSGGALPTDPKLAEQVQDELAKRARAGR